MRFEWDEAKNKANQKKHDGLDFETAIFAFDDPEHVLANDRVDATGEQRFQLIGQIRLPTRQMALLLVVHVYRKDKENGEEIIRIISAREADNRERRRYIQKAAE